MKALVTGATGFVGRALCARLQRPRVLSRSAAHAREALGAGVEALDWDPLAGPPPADAFRDVDAVFHLMGENVGEGRWTAAKKARIHDSRVVGTRNLVAGMAPLPRKPRVLVSFSAVGWYGDRGDAVVDEADPPADDFLGRTCAAWEDEARRAEDLGVRVVRLRLGVVLGPDGGALAQMLLPFRMGVGGPLGGGRQWMSWIHRDDVVALALHAAGKEGLSGPVNAVSPRPVTNGEFSKALGAALHRPAFLPMPGLALRLIKGDFAAVLLSSTRALPKAAEASGFRFSHPEVGAALRAVLAG